MKSKRSEAEGSSDERSSLVSAEDTYESFAFLLSQEEASPQSEKARSPLAQLYVDGSFILYPKRWGVLASFGVLSMNSAWIWITWSPIANEMAQFWRVGLSEVDALSGIFFYVYVPCSFLSLYLVVNYLGLKRGLLVGAFFNVIGAIVRYYFFDSYKMVYFGTFLCAIAQTYTLATPPLISNNWFGATERGRATALGVLANQLGTAVGLGITTILNFQLDPLSREEGQNPFPDAKVLNESLLETYLALQAAIAVLAFILIALFGGDEPPTPPSEAAASISLLGIGNSKNVDNKVEGIFLQDATLRRDPPSYFESVSHVFSSFAKVAYILSFGMTVGVFYTIPTFLSQITPDSYSSSLNGWLGVLYQFTGVLGSLESGRVMDATQKHRSISLVFLLAGALSLALLALFVHDPISEYSGWASGFAVISSITVAGVCLAAWNTVGLELGTGVYFPADAAAVAGILESAAELFAFLWVLIGGVVVEYSASLFVFMLALIAACSASILLLLDTRMQRPS